MVLIPPITLLRNKNCFFAFKQASAATFTASLQEAIFAPKEATHFLVFQLEHQEKEKGEEQNSNDPTRRNQNQSTIKLIKMGKRP